jgi:hypothetical protein
MALTKPIIVNPFANTVAPGPSDLFDAPSYMDSGFPAPAGVPVRPPLGFFNWLFNYCTNGIRYLCARAISDWDSTETQYVPGSVVFNNDFYFWMLIGTATTGTRPDADTGNWARLNMLDRGHLADYTRTIAEWRNYVGKRAFVVDHQGMPGGRIWTFDESWLSANPTTVSTRGAPTRWFGPWLTMFHGTNASQHISAEGGGADSTLTSMPWGPTVRVHADGGGASAQGTAVLESAVPFFRMGPAAFSMAFDFSVLNGIGSIDASSSFAFGLGDGTVQFDTSDVGFNDGGGPKPVGVALYAKGAGNPWKRYVNISGTPVSPVDSAVNLADGAVHRVKFEIVGASSSDTGPATIITRIDNVVIDALAADLGGKALFPFFRMSSSAVDDVSQICIGPLQTRARLSAGDDI